MELRTPVQVESMPRPPSDTVQISARVPTSWLEQFDAVAKRLSRPGLEVTRADAYRIALARGLDELREELKLSEPAPTQTKRSATARDGSLSTTGLLAPTQWPVGTTFRQRLTSNLMVVGEVVDIDHPDEVKLTADMLAKEPSLRYARCFSATDPTGETGVVDMRSVQMIEPSEFRRLRAQIQTPPKKTKKKPVIPIVPTFRIVDVTTGDDLGEVEVPGGGPAEAHAEFLRGEGASMAGRDLVAARLTGRPGMNPRAHAPVDAIVLGYESANAGGGGTLELFGSAQEVAQRVREDRAAAKKKPSR